MRPAHATKHLPVLSYTINNATYHLAQENDSSETGSTLWLSSQYLATYLSLNSPKGRSRTAKRSAGHSLTDTTVMRRCTVLELGAGIGLLALVMRDLGFHVTATDCAAITPLLRANISGNPPLWSTLRLTALQEGMKDVVVEELDWCSDSNDNAADIHEQERVEEEEEGGRKFDIILLADVVYAPSLIGPLVATMRRSSHPRTVLYLAQEVRVPELMEDFLTRCRAWFKVIRIGEEEVGKVATHLQMTERALHAPRRRRRSSLDACHDFMDKEQADAGEDEEDQEEEEEEDWSGVSIYKLKPRRDSPIITSTILHP